MLYATVSIFLFEINLLSSSQHLLFLSTEIVFQCTLESRKFSLVTIDVCIFDAIPWNKMAHTRFDSIFSLFFTRIFPFKFVAEKSVFTKSGGKFAQVYQSRKVLRMDSYIRLQ